MHITDFASMPKDVFFYSAHLVSSIWNIVGEGIESVVNASQDSFADLFVSSGYPQVGDIPLLNRKVFKGYRVTAQEHPYVVSVRRQFSHYVTGTLLTKKLVITVAQPLYDVPVYELGIVAGETYCDRGTISRTVVFVVIHEDFNPYTLVADLAMLRLYEEFVYKISVKPIALISPGDTLTDERVFVTGWGRCDLTGKELCLPRSTRFTPGEKTDPMMKTISFVVTFPNYYCDGYKRHETPLRPGMLCLGEAREENVVAPCLAVPGAPLVANARLVGLLSWGYGCGYQNDLPLVYTDIRQYEPWIIHNIPILRNISQENLTDIFQAMRAYTLTNWLSLTREDKTFIRLHSVQNVVQRNLDIELAKLKGDVFDIRDFMYSGDLRELKRSMIDRIRMELNNQKSEVKRLPPEPVTTFPFLDRNKLENEENSWVKDNFSNEDINPKDDNLDEPKENYDIDSNIEDDDNGN